MCAEVTSFAKGLFLAVPKGAEAVLSMMVLVGPPPAPAPRRPLPLLDWPP
jgi:hypothetical protein